ncbi:unnamed protein product [Sphagnum jensenii]|uniref:Uncharacterized protein n=1 Tax=Sphagnum jensenii TaxID=128206 RepID=A0ABP0WVH8_9BRYO
MIFSSDIIDCFENARFVCYYLFLLCEYGINLEVGLGKYEAHSRESYQKACEYYKRTRDANAALHRMPHYLTAEQAPDLQHGCDKKGMDEGAGMPTATRAICGTMRPVLIHKVMVIPFRKKPQTGINHSTRWFFGHTSLLDTPEVKSVPEPADSEQATASSISVSGNPGESHVDGTKASELISNDKPCTI